LCVGGGWEEEEGCEEEVWEELHFDRELGWAEMYLFTGWDWEKQV